MLQGLGVKARARRAVESALRRGAKPVRRLMLATGRDRSPILPEIVQIESTNICNAKCVFCPRDEMHRRQGVMAMDLFRKIVDECAQLGITHIRVHNYGEPFMDRRLTEKVRYAKQKGIREVGMISNGSLITEDVARGMVEAGLDAINISVDASGREVFEATRLGLNYDKVIANIERLVRIRAELGKRRPKLILSFVRQNNSADEQAFIEHWRAIADKIHVTDLHNWAGTLNRDSDVNYPCYRPWLTFTVLWDGRVSLCCADFDGRTILGNLNTSTIREVWNAEPYVQARRAHLESGGPDICRSCDLPRKDSPLWITKLAGQGSRGVQEGLRGGSE
ncbi:MAG TPA: radical SAM/SPASM domain-containing protein [Vicinamibacterales bacterium]|jgi:MoaA/NifB/PqqE/SkfB family radical SAM enzyme|nr:radical SAM/SPASM domain-containing protein [Vicinamibacterales bacterium]